MIHLITTMNNPCLHFELNEAWILSPESPDPGDAALMKSRDKGADTKAERKDRSANAVWSGVAEAWPTGATCGTARKRGTILRKETISSHVSPRTQDGQGNPLARGRHGGMGMEAWKGRRQRVDTVLAERTEKGGVAVAGKFADGRRSCGMRTV